MHVIKYTLPSEQVMYFCVRAGAVCSEQIMCGAQDSPVETATLHSCVHGAEGSGAKCG